MYKSVLSLFTLTYVTFRLQIRGKDGLERKRVIPNVKSIIQTEVTDDTEENEHVRFAQYV